MTFDLHKNLAVSAVATAPSPATSGTSLVVTAGHGSRFPTPPFNATIWPNNALPDPSNSEIVRVTGISTDTLTITRAQESTSARTVVVGDLIAATVTAKSLTDIEAAAVGGPVLLVAASNAPTSVKAAANYTCDGTADDVQMQAANDVLGSQGGIVQLSAGDFTIAATVTLSARVRVVGAGHETTRITRANATMGPTFANFVSTSLSVASANATSVVDLKIFGNKANVTPASTTTSGTNNQDATTLNVTSGAALPAAPNWVVINYANGTREVVRYTAKVSNALTLQDGLQFTHSASETVHHYWAEILLGAYPSWDNTNTADVDYDLMHKVQNVWIEQGTWDGIAVYGRSVAHLDHLEVGDCNLRGVAVGADSWLTNANVGLSGHEGVNVSNNAHIVNVAAFYSGNNLNGRAIFGQGFRIEGDIGGHLSNCIAQDNKSHGYLFSFSDGFTLASCIADSNGTLWDIDVSGTTPATFNPYAGVAFDNATNNSVLGLTCMARVTGFENQKHAIAFLNGNSSSGNIISLTHRSAGYAVLAPVNPTAGYGTGSLNDLSIGNQGGHQSITLANGSTQTLPVPDPYAGGYITFSQVFNGAAVWTLPATTNMHPGVEMTFVLVQNATGGGTVTFNAQYLSEGWQPSSVPSSRSQITFAWDGTNWLKKGFSDYEKAVVALRWHEATTAGAWTTSPVNVYGGANGQRQLVNFRGYAQVRLIAHILTTGTVVHRIRVWDGTNVLAQADSATTNAEQELDTGWIAVPAAFLNVSDTLITVQRQITSGTSTGDVHRSTSVYLR